MSDRLTLAEAFDRRYHVPRSQVYGGSRGGQSGHVHLYVKPGEVFEAGRIRRVERQSLCGKRAWMDRDPFDGETPCPRCLEIGTRLSGRITGMLAPAVVPEETL